MLAKQYRHILAGLFGYCRLLFRLYALEVEDCSLVVGSIGLEVDRVAVAAYQADCLTWRVAYAVGVASIAFLVAVGMTCCIVESRVHE